MIPRKIRIWVSTKISFFSYQLTDFIQRSFTPRNDPRVQIPDLSPFQGITTTAQGMKGQYLGPYHVLTLQMLFFGTRCERLCMIQFSLISLIPGLIDALQDCADPSFDTYAETVEKPTSLKTSDRSSCKLCLWSYLTMILLTVSA